MKKKYMLFIFILISFLTYGEIVTSFEEISKPQVLSISRDRLLITEGPNIYVYSMKDFKLLKKFGKAGEGPQEFKVSPFGVPMIAYFSDGNIFVSSDSKISYFSTGGDFIKEMKTPPFSLFRPFKNYYVATGNSTNNNNQMIIVINLHNSRLEKVKELYQSDVTVGQNASFNYPTNNFTFEPYKDRLYLVRGKEGFVIDVMSLDGKRLYTIKKEYKEIKVDQEYRDKTFQQFKSDPNFKQFFEYLKQRIKFKKYYPAIQDIRVIDDRIHVITFKKNNKDTECIILDLKGNELKRVYVPYPELHGMDYLPEYDIFNKKFYILIENEDEEVWELHVKDL
ncbi:MAG: hypothetical protein ABFR75_04980 [Acidobacteriota bacterium]